MLRFGTAIGVVSPTCDRSTPLYRKLKLLLKAVFFYVQVWCAFVIASGKAPGRETEIGQRSDFEVAMSFGRSEAIAQGLKAGETAILYPSETIADGKGVRASAPR
jgi:hypothetical protein